MSVYMGIDIGGTTCRVGAYDGIDQPNRLVLEQFNWKDDYKVDYPHMLEVIEKVRKEAGGNLAGIGIGTAGSLDPDRKFVTASASQHSWDHQPLVEPIEQRFGVKVELGNDSEAAALGEAYYGKGKDKSFWFVIWGTGVGAAFVRRDNDNQPHTLPTEMGHAQVDPSGPEDKACGVKGCTEAFCGGKQIERRFGKPAKELSEEEWKDVEGHMAVYVYNLFRAHEVGLVVVGGGVAGKQPQRLKNVGELTKQYFHYLDPPEVTGSSLQEESGLLGALAFNHHTLD